jgi:alcohol dehydrogenase class IV
MKLSPMPEVVGGGGALSALHRFLRDGGIRSVVIVTGPTVSRLPQFAAVHDACAQGGRSVAVFSRTVPDPTLEVAREAASFARDFGAQAVVGIGGGSPLDTAKVVAALLTNSGSVEDLIGIDKVSSDAAPLVAIPTTAGTGSEVTNVSILTDVAANLKKAIVSDRLVPKLALLLPELTLGLPPATTAATGMDALCHAAESVISRRRNPVSDALAFGALSRIAVHLPRVIRDPSDTGSREAMMEASLMAGLAFNNSSVTAIHAFAYPLGGRFHVPHGLANSLMFAPVMRHNESSEPMLFAALSRAFSGRDDSTAFVSAVETLRASLPIPQTLRQAGIPEDSLEPMADDLMTIERLLSVNPRGITRVDAGRIFREAWEGAKP